MKKYIINEIYSDGYERFAMLEESEWGTKITVHFLERVLVIGFLELVKPEGMLK